MTRPLLICDADEVLVRFAATFTAFCEHLGLTLRLDSFALFGNLRHGDGSLVSNDEIGALITRFFEERVEACPPLPGAVEALADLADIAEIVVLTNVPDAQRARRERAFAAHGMPYPVIANQGLKGPAVRDLAAGRQRPVVFVDDVPQHHESVFAHAPQVHRLHMVGDPMLRDLLDDAVHAHQRIDSWDEALPLVRARLLAE